MKTAPLPQPQQKLPNRFRVQIGGFRKLKFWERVKIALGYNLTSHVELLVDKRDGRVWNKVIISLTKQTNLEAQRQDEDEL